ncbi:putative zinc finger protein [Orchesella cincta]|uniref:Putative zinc finger protein n=1 Tax=Orchesella cincta TaxID=48709 RepID=A0A1D2MU80_ORCCI|nr:putative zinc finger protein [Orchesella cincta]
MLARLSKKVGSRVSSRTHRTYAAEISNCWNTSTSSTSNQSQQFTSCLLCSTPVALSSIPETTQSSLKRGRMLSNMCHHLKISSSEIPIQCSQAISALCPGCEKRMVVLWKFQGHLDLIGFQISKVVAQIERTVVDDQILNNASNIPDQRVIPIREKILEGYRSKLQLKRIIHGSVVLLGDDSSPPSVPNVGMKEEFYDNLISSELTRSASTSSSTGRSDETEEIIVNDPNDYVIPGDIYVSNSGSVLEYSDCEEVEVIIPDDNNNQVFSMNETIPEVNENETVEAESNENGCNSIIQYVHDSGRNTNVGAASSAVQIKQEMIGAFANNEEDVNVDEVDSDSDDIMAVELRKRRKFCEGVEIYKCIGKRDGKQFLQCGSCTFNVTIPQNKARGSTTSFMKMKAHIKTAHKDEPRHRGRPKNTKISKCEICSKSFRCRKSLREHKKTHKILCEVCERPMKDNSQRNLLKHMFTHKNEEEQRIAIANGEVTPRNTTQRRKMVRKKKRKGTKNNPISGQEHKCTICGRGFARKNYIALHMRSHKKLMEMRAARVDPEPLVLQRKFVEGTIEEFCNALGMVRSDWSRQSSPDLKLEVVE